MQCANCNFFNMPGSEVCGRCGTSLMLGGVTVATDVTPPRAGRLAKRLRRVAPMRRTYYRARDALADTRTPDSIRRWTPRLPEYPVFIRLIFPGWSHFYLRQRLRGHLFLWSFLACQLLMLLNFGTTWGGIWLGTAFSVHSSAALDIVTQTFADAGVRDRIVRSIALSVLLWFGVYWPAGLLIGRFASPYIVQFAMQPFVPGDVVLVNNLSRPRAGQVVLYQLSDYHIMLAGAIHERREEIFTGQAIDRILAGPGDTVECLQGRMLVNSQPSKFVPLNPVKLRASFKLIVPDGDYFIVPSGAPRIDTVDDAAAWSGIGCVPAESIVGRAYMRSSPLSRCGLIH
jgi:hypothetical protein